MAIPFDCPGCMKHFELPETMAKRKLKCPECQFTFIVPGPARITEKAEPAQPTLGPGETRPVNPRRPPTTQAWFYTRDGKSKSEPVSFAHLQALAKAGQLLPTDMVLVPGMNKWLLARSIGGLF